MSNLSPDFVLPENFCANPQEAWTIPARFYTDQNAFEHEKENVFAKSWICVAHSSELANANDYVQSMKNCTLNMGLWCDSVKSRK